ncbi:hypothetical protein KIN20_025282 [Parelaphostrongylus tenuis]|uniref:Uncharacterized protein n=1 Tax=Parelaphostrongylus tenuis TaxID=148309 RepID=A0AAD5N8N2_PARTN|nr:hypothetical protein KIN20_025282 [Parelaphostrongylus tenuis]
MAYSTSPALQAQVPGISPNLNPAKAFVKCFVIKGVLDVLKQQGRVAGLSDVLMAVILCQRGVNVIYTPPYCSLTMVSPTAMCMFTILSIHLVESVKSEQKYLHIALHLLLS